MKMQISKQTITYDGSKEFVKNFPAVSEGELASNSDSIFVGEILLRLPQVLQIFPVSKSNWWEGVKTGKYPKGLKISGRMTAWKLSDIQKRIENFK